MLDEEDELELLLDEDDELDDELILVELDEEDELDVSLLEDDELDEVSDDELELVELEDVWLLDEDDVELELVDDEVEELELDELLLPVLPATEQAQIDVDDPDPVASAYIVVAPLTPGFVPSAPYTEL